LKQLAGGGDGLIDQQRMARSIAGTLDQVVEYTLTLCHTQNDMQCDIVFRDYPGRWLDEIKQQAKIGSLLKDAQIILIAVDAPALMVHTDSAHEQVNRPVQIANALSRAFRAGPRDHQRLVLFSLMRCERWVQEGGDEAMLAAFERRYGRVLRVLEGYKNSTAVAVCPIQTLGSVQFVRFDEQGRHVFEKVRGGDYRPADCDQPLRFAMAYVSEALRRYADSQAVQTKKSIDNQDWYTRWKRSALNLFGVHTADQKRLSAWYQRASSLRHAVETFAEGCKQNPPFVVRQGAELLGLLSPTLSEA
jgi:hypothetical protein